MNKFISILLLSAFLAACFDSGSSSSGSDSGSDSEVGSGSSFNPADFTVNQLNDFSESGESTLSIQLNNLTNDDAIYLTASSSDMENSRLNITPFKTVLNPTDGTAQVTLRVKDTGLTSQPSIHVLVTTSGNTSMEQTLDLNWGNEL